MGLFYSLIPAWYNNFFNYILTSRYEGVTALFKVGPTYDRLTQIINVISMTVVTIIRYH